MKLTIMKTTVNFDLDAVNKSNVIPMVDTNYFADPSPGILEYNEGTMETGHLQADGSILILPIGKVRSRIEEQQTGGFEPIESTIELKEQYLEFLTGLTEYSHLKVIYWLSEMTDTHALHQPQSNPDAPYVGMFACR